MGSLVAIVALVLSTNGASAEDSLPWTDNFDDGKLDNWTVITDGGGTVKVDQTQSKSSPYGLHIRSMNAGTDKAIASPNITYNTSVGILVQFDFRISPNYHWIIVWSTYETHLVADAGRFIARDHRGINTNIQAMATNRWYHIKIHYNATTERNTIWVDGVERLTFREVHWHNDVEMGDVFASANHGEAFWDNFNVTYLNAPDPPVPISPIDNASFDWIPDLEWRFVDRSPGDFQTGYQVQVANESEFSDPIWDSGWVKDTNTTVDPPYLQFGAWYWRVRVRDNETLWSDWSPPAEFVINNTNKPPVWGPIPVLTAVEDIPVTYDFTDYISDPDDVMGNLTMECTSPYVTTNILDFNLTFLFGEGVTEANITLVLRDRWNFTVVYVLFTIQPVNDPPTHTVPLEHTAMEDIPLVLNLAPFLHDIDNALWELSLVVNDSFTEVNAFNLTVTFPDGILAYDLWFELTDGELGVPIHLSFTVTPVNDPPVVQELGTFNATEDVDSLFDLRPYLYDVDDPVEGLGVIERSPNCTVVGHMLHFMYTLGGVEETVLVQVTDGHSMAEGVLVVQVEERNDAPVVLSIAPQQFTEDTEGTIDLSDYLTDEDDYVSDLIVSCDHPSLVRVDGRVLTFKFTFWQPEHTVYVNVSDGYLFAAGQFLAQVASVNDAPVILGIGEYIPPVTIELPEATTLDLQVQAYDEDDTNLRYFVSTTWSGVTVGTDGMLAIDAVHGDVGVFNVTLAVDDPSGARAELPFTIKVINVNDPPGWPFLMEPTNHTTVEEGTNLTFAVVVTDPDEMFGQILTVTWMSNISGLIGTRTSDGELNLVTDDLPVGQHRITVQVTDGDYTREAWLEISVIERYVPPDTNGDDGPSMLTGTTGVLVFVVIVVLVLLLVANFLIAAKRRADKGDELSSFPVDVPEVSVELEDGTAPDLADLSHKLDVMTTELETQRAAEVAAHPQPTTAMEPVVIPQPVEAPPPPETPPTVDEPISEEEEAARAHATETRDVMRLLTQLPRGLPTELWNMDMSLLAKEIVDGPKRTAPDGTPLVKIKRTWYSADRTSVGNFLREHHDQGPGATAAPSRDAATKLEQLEERLLDGKISEETYERLRKKYGG